jgi:hypothetical protein
MDVGDILMDLGFIPFIPLLSHFQDIVHPRDEIEWLDWDLEWLKMCDAMIRIKPIIDGKELTSGGADIEEKTAIEHKIPVYTFNTLEEVKSFSL